MLKLGQDDEWIEHSSNDHLFSHLKDKSDIRRRLWKCFKLWTTRPNAYDRSVGAVRLFYYEASETTIGSLQSLLLDKESFDVEYLVNSLKELPGQCDDGDKSFPAHDCHQQVVASFVVRVAFSKGVKSSGVSICVFHCDIDNDSLTCLTPGSREKSYRISFDGLKTVTVQIPVGVSEDGPTVKLLSRFFTKAAIWSTIDPSCTPSVHSLTLVEEDAYLSMYNRLKIKYGESLRQMWTECTNPGKFIYEDIAIASYLNLLWKSPKTFVDLGCGNGLLVYILTAEGHRGLGLDVRARKIWTQYPITTELKVEAINPSDCRFSEVDWIIGNHSDELTPWIPVIAAKSSYKTQFFLLPCCSYEFSGEKYKRSDTSKSQYSDYMDYVESICVQCGFKVARDRLKIPSTKRICFVSQGRVYGSDELDRYCEKISELVKVGSSVKIRESVERVRNCTKLDRNLVADIVSQVSRLILDSRPTVEYTSFDWNEGNYVELCQIAQALGSNRLTRLKNECGGLQTLLRNHRFMFQIEGGCVKFRKPRVLTTRPSRWKVVHCWFYRNHPQSCPLDDEMCSFIHA